MKRPRQFIVTHTATRVETIVNGFEYFLPSGQWSGNYDGAAAGARHRYPADCTVRVVPFGMEVELPFDLPMVRMLTMRTAGLATGAGR